MCALWLWPPNIFCSVCGNTPIVALPPKSVGVGFFVPPAFPHAYFLKRGGGPPSYLFPNNEVVPSPDKAFFPRWFVQTVCSRTFFPGPHMFSLPAFVAPPNWGVFDPMDFSRGFYLRRLLTRGNKSL